MNNDKLDIEEITDTLQTEIMEVWKRIDCKSFNVEIKRNLNGTINLIPLLDDMLSIFNVDHHKDITGVYMIYVADENSEELFYVGESRSSIFRRLQRHFNKIEKIKQKIAPERYKPFMKLLQEDKNVQIKILKFENQNDDIKYRRIIEEILTLSEKPTYIDDLNENLLKKKNAE